MADEKSGKKPDQEGGTGEAQEDPSGEASGRSRQLLYTCWKCGAANYVTGNWNYFVCSNDHALNYM